VVVHVDRRNIQKYRSPALEWFSDLLLKSAGTPDYFHYLGNELEKIQKNKYAQKYLNRLFTKLEVQELEEIQKWLTEINTDQFDKLYYSLIHKEHYESSLNALNGILEGKSAYALWPSNQRKPKRPLDIVKNDFQATIIFDGLHRKGYSKKTAYDLTYRITNITKRNIDKILKNVQINFHDVIGDNTKNKDTLVLCAFRTEKKWLDNLSKENLHELLSLFSE